MSPTSFLTAPPRDFLLGLSGAGPERYIRTDLRLQNFKLEQKLRSIDPVHGIACLAFGAGAFCRWLLVGVTGLEPV